MNKHHILTFLQENKNLLKDKYGVEKIGLYGSYVKDAATRDSDIDFYVILRNKTLDNMTGLWNYLESKLGKRVDILYYHPRIREGLKKEIEREVIYA